MGALEQILERHPVWRGGTLAAAIAAVPTGFGALDARLPGGGWPCQGLTEILHDQAGIGELALILPALAALTRAGKRALMVAPPYIPYAPACMAAGLDLTRMLWVRPADSHARLWAAEQGLRSGSCGALVAWLAKPRYAELQRLAVAAEASQAAAFIYRPLAAADESSPACLRVALEAAGTDVAVHVVKRRGAPLAGPLKLPLGRSFHAVGRGAPSGSGGPGSPAARRLGLPVHA
jgi:protein ImuA